MSRSSAYRRASSALRGSSIKSFLVKTTPTARTRPSSAHHKHSKAIHTDAAQSTLPGSHWSPKSLKQHRSTLHQILYTMTMYNTQLHKNHNTPISHQSHSLQHVSCITQAKNVLFVLTTSSYRLHDNKLNCQQTFPGLVESP